MQRLHILASRTPSQVTFPNDVTIHRQGTEFSRMVVVQGFDFQYQISPLFYCFCLLLERLILVPQHYSCFEHIVIYSFDIPTTVPTTFSTASSGRMDLIAILDRSQNISLHFICITFHLHYITFAFKNHEIHDTSRFKCHALHLHFMK